MISFRDSEIEARAEQRSDARASASVIARRDLERYYTLLSFAESELKFELNELKLIYDICNGISFEPAMLDPMILANIEDAFCHANYAEKWSVDKDALLAKLRALTPLQSWALVTRVEKFWAKAE